jgi:hypothetical protein
MDSLGVCPFISMAKVALRKKKKKKKKKKRF